MCLNVSAVDGVYSERNCSYQDVLNHLNLTKTNELYSMTRPDKNYKQPTEIFLAVLLYAILDVVSGSSFKIFVNLSNDTDHFDQNWTVCIYFYFNWLPNSCSTVYLTDCHNNSCTLTHARIN